MKTIRAVLEVEDEAVDKVSAEIVRLAKENGGESKDIKVSSSLKGAGATFRGDF